MTNFQLSQTQSMRMQPGLRQIIKMQQANLLQMPQDELHRLIIEIEQRPFFLKLYRQEKLIRYQRFPRTSIPASFYQLKEGMVADTGSLDVETLLLNKEHIVCQIQKLGVVRFKRYFLFPESGMTLEEIAEECDLDVSEVKEINSLIDEFSVMSEFYHPSNFTSDVIHYSKIASVDMEKDGFVISYFSPSFARGRYLINYQRFEELYGNGAFSKTEAREARQLFKKMELINSCKDTINQILQNVIKKQALYLETGNAQSLLPFSQKELARMIGLATSSVSRAIGGKSIDTPWGEEIPLKRLFPRPKRFRKELLKQLLETDDKLSSDEAIRTILWSKFGVAISRRSITNLRKELRFPIARSRKESMGARKTK